MTSQYPIVSDSHLISEANLKLADSYFDEEISTLKTGNFGYTNAIIANAIKNGILHRSLLYNEMFLNTASMPESIMNFSNQLNYVAPDATPSKTTVSFAIAYEDVKNYAELNGGKFLIPRADVFNFEKVSFSLPFSVVIAFSGASVIAEYDVSEKEVVDYHNETYRSNPFIKTWISQDEDGVQYLFLLLDLYQFSTISKEFEVMSKNASESLLYNVEYDNQLVNFHVKYNGEDIPKFYDPNIIPETEKYIYWDKVSDDEFQLFFSPLDSRFRPKFGSKIEVDVYTSNGTKGNFSFGGNVAFAFSAEGLDKIPVVVTTVSDPSGGKDGETLLETKKNLLHVTRSRDSIISDYDIEEFFSKMARENLSKSAKVQFAKTRDDIVSRVYSAFLMLTDENSSPIPTNTLDFSIPYSTIEERNYKFQAGTMFIFDENTNKLRPLRDDEFSDEFLSDPENFVYSIPYMTELKLSPIPRMVYYDTFISEKVTLFYYPVKAIQSGREYLLPEFDIRRNPVVEDTYTITSSFSASGSEIDPNVDISLMVIFKDKGRAIGYTKLDYDILEDNFSKEFPTDDSFDEYGRIRIGNVTSLETDLDYIFAPADLEIEVGAFLYTGSSKYSEGNFSLINHDSVSNKQLVATFKTPQPIRFFKNLSSVIKSDVFITEGGSVEFKSVPLVASRFFFNTAKYEKFIGSLNTYMDILESNITRLGSSTTVDFKFFNTYGPSYLYDLTRTNLSLDLTIKLLGGYSNEIDSTIREVIWDFIVESNEEKRLIVSNLTTLLKQRIPEIDYVEFNSLNEDTKQVIKYLYDTDIDISKQLISAPEYLSINTIQSTIDNSSDKESLKIRYT